MKKVTNLLLIFLFVFISSSFSIAASEAEIINSLSKNIASSMKIRNGVDVIVKVDILKKIDKPQGYYFIKLSFYDKKNPKELAGEQFIFSDGAYIIPDIMNVEDMGSLAKELSFEFSKRDVNVNGLTPILGKAGAKNVIIEVSDFQCPYCIKANEYLHNKLKNRNDVVVYLMHFPLRNMHPKAEILAKIFEAGMALGKNFGNELYNVANHGKSDVVLINEFATKSGNPKKFKELVASEQIKNKVLNAEKQAKELGISSTPTLFVNGKMISGFDTVLIDKAISEFK